MPKGKSATALRPPAGVNTRWQVAKSGGGVLLWVVLPLLATPTGLLMAGQAELSVLTGLVANGPSPLRLRQDAWPELKLCARFATRPLHFPLYYALRVGRAGRRLTLEGELVHHKLYLGNPPPEIQAFALTHGFNMLLGGASVAYGGFRWRAGVGMVVAHPETVVRGRRHTERGGLWGRGYFLSGPVLQLALERRQHLYRGFGLVGEIKFTAASARFPIAGGEATMTHWAIHLLLGVVARMDGSCEKRGARPRQKE